MGTPISSLPPAASPCGTPIPIPSVIPTTSLEIVATPVVITPAYIWLPRPWAYVNGAIGNLSTIATPTVQPSPVDQTERLSPAAVSGITVGSVAGATLVAGLIAWIIMRQKPRPHHDYRSSSAQHVPSPGMREIEIPKPLFDDLPDVRYLHRILPVPADDETIMDRINGLYEAVGLHVDNFYKNRRIRVPGEVKKALVPFESSSLPAKLEDLLMQGLSQKTVITRALIEMLISSIDPRNPIGNCLLPREMTVLPRALNENQLYSQEICTFFWWRMLTIHLRQNGSSIASMVRDPDYLIPKLVNTFQAAFQPWRNTAYTDQDEANALSAIFTSAAETGIWLFEQRQGLVFRWSREVSTGTASVGALETRPALLELSDANGRVWSGARTLIPGTVAKLGFAVL